MAEYNQQEWIDAFGKYAPVNHHPNRKIEVISNVDAPNWVNAHIAEAAIKNINAVLESVKETEKETEAVTEDLESEEL